MPMSSQKKGCPPIMVHTLSSPTSPVSEPKEQFLRNRPQRQAFQLKALNEETRGESHVVTIYSLILGHAGFQKRPGSNLTGDAVERGPNGERFSALSLSKGIFWRSAR